MEEVSIKDTIKVASAPVDGQVGFLKINLNGYLDTFNSQGFQEHIINQIKNNNKFLIFDCNGLSYISSTGIGAFTAFYKILESKRGSMVLIGVGAKVLEVFNLLGFSSYFKISNSYNEALDQLVAIQKATGGGAPAASESKPAASGASTATAATPATASTFPIIYTCPNCKTKSKISAAGKYRCSGCKGIFSVDATGKTAIVS